MYLWILVIGHSSSFYGPFLWSFVYPLILYAFSSKTAGNKKFFHICKKSSNNPE